MHALAVVLLMSALTDLPSAEEVQERVNQRHDGLYCTDSDRGRLPCVCVVCDKFLVSSNERKHLTVKKLVAARERLHWSTQKDDRRKPEVEAHFSVDHEALQNFALSPRAPFYKNGNNVDGYSACQRCYKNIMHTDGPRLPRHAIINSNYIGAPPDCLTELTEPELAFLTPIKHYGYCFTFTGGKQKCLKGTLSFMRVSKHAVTRAVTTLEAAGLNDNALILYSGELTEWQRQRAKELCSARTEKLIRAVDWLVENNSLWRHINKASIRHRLESASPVVEDRSTTVDGENANVEEQEIFTCYYPDSTANASFGGCSHPNGFKDFVTRMARDGHDGEFQANLRREYIQSTEDVLVEANLLQFPYGVGGMYDKRELPNGSRTSKSDLDEFVQELSLNSQPVFQRPLFQLMLCSLACKNMLLRSSRLQLRGKTDAANLASGLNEGDVLCCIGGRRMKNRFAGTRTSRLLLDAVDATAADLPHTNEAAKKARQKGEAMQHHFGMGSVFLTCTFDDENSLLMEVFSREESNDEATKKMSDIEVTQRAKDRRSLRIQCPGIAALNFEMLLEILMEEVIGWDLKRNAPMVKKVGQKQVKVKGHFGDVEALSFAVEEQGRKTLHVHMTLWVEGFKAIQSKYFFGNKTQKRDATNALRDYTEHISSTSFFPDNVKKARTLFDHDCSVDKKDRRAPRVIDEDQLRILRNRKGHKDTGGVFATCPEEHCDKDWSCEELMIDYLKRSKELGYCQPIASKTESNQRNDQLGTLRARMMAETLAYQKGNRDKPTTFIDATYHHHYSCHVRGCWKCQKPGSKKRKHVCGPNCECRMRLPDVKRARAEVFVNHESVEWYLWNGSVRSQPIAQIVPKRRKYDLFQNVSCPAISYSKFSCNNNVSPILDGPIGQYQHKYQEKETQKEDTAEYSEVEALIRNFDCERKHEADRPEALRRICRAAFAHNKKNVISPCFASYLLRHRSRFYYSHEFKYCPLRDVVRLHNKEDISGMLKFDPDSKEQYFENTALDYLCRNEQLEQCNLARFTNVFCQKHVPVNNDEDVTGVYPCIPKTAHYSHPSVIKSKKSKRVNQCARGAKARDSPVLFRVCQWMFPDTASFGADILTCDESQFNNNMEGYAQLVLTLFMPHRHSSDIKAEGGSFPYVRKFREVYESESELDDDNKVVFTDANVKVLQNVQNCRSNTLRHKAKEDPLTSQTEPYKSDTKIGNEKDDEDDLEEIETSFFEDIMNTFQEEDEVDAIDKNPAFLPSKLNGFTFNNMKDLGEHYCGYQNDAPTPPMEENLNFVNYDHSSGRRAENIQELPGERKHYNCDDLVKLHFKKRTPIVKTLWQNKDKKKDIKVKDAVGSPKSIREWSKAAFPEDRKQRRAFEVLTSSFVLTFYHETKEKEHNQVTVHRGKFRKAKDDLFKLRGIRGSKLRREDWNLVCLLHGPGGSGKSTVINAVKVYAQDYCKQLGHKCTSRTIVTTAMSGVAATLLHGETTHSVLGLNRNKIEPKEAEHWQDARLLLIDECSFASASDFDKTHDNLKELMREHQTKCGALNVVFSGDFSQLEPVNKDPVYKDGKRCPTFHGCLNCYIELDGKWRFVNDPMYGDIMFRMREGRTTPSDIDVLNERLVQDNLRSTHPPTNTQVATHKNRDRDAINASVFDEYTYDNKLPNGTPIPSACMIFMDDLSMHAKSHQYNAITSNSVKKHFYENCTENECSYDKNSRARVDPALKLYNNCPMMLTRNKDVAGGEANGTRVFVKEVRVKQGEEAFPLKLQNGSTILGLFARQVSSTLVEHECDTITPKLFEVFPETHSFVTKLHDKKESLDKDLFVRMKGNQFPLISNSCTTGHKLQGCTVDNTLVNSWHYGCNWVYVVLSRVRTHTGLYLRKRLSYDLLKCAQNEDMKKMLRLFEQTISVTYLTEEEYEAIDNAIDDEDLLPKNNDQSETSASAPAEDVMA